VLYNQKISGRPVVVNLIKPVRVASHGISITVQLHDVNQHINHHVLPRLLINPQARPGTRIIESPVLKHPKHLKEPLQQHSRAPHRQHPPNMST